ncbi:MAG: ABC transporter permease [Gemmatimonadaceae bacterium]
MTVWEREKTGEQSNLGYATYQDFARDNKTFVVMAAMGSWQPTMSGTAEPERLDGQRVTFGFFRVLGVKPAIGRDFQPDEDARGAARVVILSDGLWRRRFGGDSTFVGKQINLNGIGFIVLGVMPADFFNVLSPEAKLWTPLRYDSSLPQACRTCRHLRVLGRLRPSVDPAGAERDLGQLSVNLVRAYPQDYPASGVVIMPMREQMSRDVRPALLAVLAAVAFLLAISCANVASLLLARAAQREAEFAVRIALGAGRRRLLGQLLTESVLLAFIGGACGIAIAHGGVGLLLRLSPSDMPRLDAIGLDGRVLLFAIGISALAGVASGIAPALFSSQGSVHGTIKRGGHRVGGVRRARDVLVVSEIALALLLLVGTGLLLRSLTHLLAVRPGLDPTRVLTMEIQVTGPRYKSDTATRAFFSEALRRVQAVPGVEGAGLVSQLPLGGNFDSYGVHSESKPSPNPSDDPSADRYMVSAAYLRTMRIPLLSGRPITDQDGADSPPVLLVNETFAKRNWPGQNPIGQRVRVGDPANGPWRTIAGIVGDVHHVSLDAPQSNQVYLSESQWPWADNAMVLAMRTVGDPSALTKAVRGAVWSVDKNQAILHVATMEQVLAASAARRRFALTLFEAFALVALVLAGAGIYGVLSGSVTERAREIGIRAALGATRSDILQLVVRQGLSLAIIGIAVGALGAFALTRVIAGLLFDTRPADPVTFGSVIAVLFAVALTACAVPAWRAAQLDPVRALKAE